MLERDLPVRGGIKRKRRGGWVGNRSKGTREGKKGTELRPARMKSSSVRERKEKEKKKKRKGKEKGISLSENEIKS